MISRNGLKIEPHPRHCFFSVRRSRSTLVSSLIGISLFYGIGLGWGGKAGSALLWPLAVLINTFQLVLSRYWLRFYRSGPYGMVMALTSGSFQPMRVQPPVTAKKVTH